MHELLLFRDEHMPSTEAAAEAYAELLRAAPAERLSRGDAAKLRFTMLLVLLPVQTLLRIHATVGAQVPDGRWSP